MTKEKINNLITKMETRKNNTKQAIDDLYAIMSWLTKQVDNYNEPGNLQNIPARTSYYNNGNNLIRYNYDDDDPTYYRLACYHGEVGIYRLDAYDNREIVSSDEIDYINLKITYDALIALIDKLATISTRQDVANGFAKIRAAIVS